MRIRINKKGIIAAGVAGAILVCGAVFRMVDNKGVKHVGVANVGADHSGISDAIKEALDGEKTADAKVTTSAIAGASTIEVKEDTKEETATEAAEEAKEETATQAQTNTATRSTQTAQSSSTSKTTQSAAKQTEVINEEVKVTDVKKEEKEATTKTQQVEEYVGSDADAEKAIQKQAAEAEAKTVENFGGDQFVEGM